MYIKVTTRCNMSCRHCCFACGKNGQDMDFSTFEMIMKRWAPLINEKKQYIVIGGGEPTLHPEFWKIINSAMLYGYVWVATNGSRTEDSLELCRLAKDGYLRAVLSIDEFHEPIDRSVLNAFSEGLTPQRFGMWNTNDKMDQREIRSVTHPIKGGRCEDGLEGCCCNSIQIEPDGVIKACGCKNAPVIGSVEEGFTDTEFLEGYDIFEGCYNEHIKNKAIVKV